MNEQLTSSTIQSLELTPEESGEAFIPSHLNFVPISNAQALRLIHDSHSPKIYADKHGQIRLKFSQQYNCLVEVNCPISAPDAPFYIPEVSPATKTYLSPGKWNPEKKERKALTLAAKANPHVKLSPVDAIKASPFKFYKPKTNKYGCKTYIMLNGTIADLFKLAHEHSISCKEIPNVPHATVRAFRFGDYLIYCNKVGLELIRAQELSMWLNYGN